MLGSVWWQVLLSKMAVLLLAFPATCGLTPRHVIIRVDLLRFVHASKDVQAQMLKDPTVARVTCSGGCEFSRAYVYMLCLSLT